MLGGLGMRGPLLRMLRSEPYLGRGADMRSGLRAHSYLAYTSFWAVMLSLKFAFDYFAIVQPMVQVASTPHVVTNIPRVDTTPTHHANIPRVYTMPPTACQHTTRIYALPTAARLRIYHAYTPRIYTCTPCR